jgi:hypothetical protein
MGIALVSVEEDSIDIVAKFSHPLPGQVRHRLSTALDSDGKL